MNKIPDAYKEALLHVKQKTTPNEQLERWNRKKKEVKDFVTSTSFFVPHKSLTIKEKK